MTLPSSTWQEFLPRPSPLSPGPPAANSPPLLLRSLHCSSLSFRDRRLPAVPPCFPAVSAASLSLRSLCGSLPSCQLSPLPLSLSSPNSIACCRASFLPSLDRHPAVGSRDRNFFTPNPNVFFGFYPLLSRLGVVCLTFRPSRPHFLLLRNRIEPPFTRRIDDGHGYGFHAK